jgi:hypothetical protein
LSLRSAGPGWIVGSLLLIGAVAGQARATGSISGKLTAPASRSVSPVDADGNEVSGSAALVNAMNANYQDFRAIANADGTYKLDGLDAGTYTVVVVGNGMDPIVQKNVTVTDGKDTTQNFTLAEAQPFKILKSPGGKPIPLTDDINSASFANAPDINLDEAWQIRTDLGGSGTLLNWKPNVVSARVRMMYSAAALHLAADVNFKTPGVNNWPDNGGAEIWDGNHFDLFFQNDAYDPKRTDYNTDHNWQVVVRLTDTPVFKIFVNGAPPDGQDPDSLPQNKDIKTYALRVVKPKKDGELDRIDYPWALFQQNGSGKGPITAPADNTFGALDLSIGDADPDQAAADAHIKQRLSWSGFFEGWRHPNQLRPVVFTPQ